MGCNTVYLKKNNLIHNPDLVKTKILTSDILYFGGGDTLKLMEKIDEYHLKDILVEALNNNVVLAGISAGAILLSKKGYSDSLILRGESDQYTFIDGFDFTDIIITPHYHKDPIKTEQLMEYLKESTEEVYGIENGAAIKIEDNKMSVISSIMDAGVYKITYKKEFNEKKI